MLGNANGIPLRVNKKIRAMIPSPSKCAAGAGENRKASINKNSSRPSIPSSYIILPVSDNTLFFREFFCLDFHKKLFPSIMLLN